MVTFFIKMYKGTTLIRFMRFESSKRWRAAVKFWPIKRSRVPKSRYNDRPDSRPGAIPLPWTKLPANMMMIFDERYFPIAGPLSTDVTVIYGFYHYSDVIMSPMVSQITSISIVCSAVCLGAHKRKRRSSALLAFVPSYIRASNI